MSGQHFQPPKPRFFRLTVEGHEAEPSPELRALVQDFARELAHEYARRKQGCYDLLRRYPDDEWMKQQWTPENIEKFASGEDQTTALERLRSKPFDEIAWDDVHDAAAQDIEQATLCLNVVYDAAFKYIASGLQAADAVGFRSPFERAQFTVIRNGFVDDWQPRGAVESGLVDMLAQTYVAWQYWLSRSFSIANNEDTVIEQKARTKKPYDDSGTWQPMRLTAAEYLERATQMADRYQRMYMRTLRQMRDLRRYFSPVVIQNAGQVNVAADGGQQTNIQRKAKKKTKAKVTTPARPAIRLASNDRKRGD